MLCVEVILKIMPKNITFVLPSLRIGGAEKFVISFANYLAKRSEFNVNLLLLVSNKKEKKYVIEDSVNIISLNSSSTLFSFPKLLLYMWTQKPDICFSTLVHLNFLISFVCIFFPKKTVTIIREAAVISSYLSEKKSFWMKLLYRIVYNYPTCVICQSNDMKKDLVLSGHYLLH